MKKLNMPKEFKTLAGFGALIGLGCIAMTYLYGEMRYSDGAIDCGKAITDELMKMAEELKESETGSQN